MEISLCEIGLRILTVLERLIAALPLEVIMVVASLNGDVENYIEKER